MGPLLLMALMIVVATALFSCAAWEARQRRESARAASVRAALTVPASMTEPPVWGTVEPPPGA